MWSWLIWTAGFLAFPIAGVAGGAVAGRVDSPTAALVGWLRHRCRYRPLETWNVAAVGPGWRPPPGEPELLPVPGRLEFHADALIFRADDAVDRRTGEPLVAVVHGASVRNAGPLSPGTYITPTKLAGLWMPRLLRRLRCPGFAMRTSDGVWAFDCPAGVRRAREVSRRYAG